ncbi:hypothetical protein [Anatilimnocola aggregata]|uniref:hypothetical protein n=1 Tax=Anatilimnocola aggregata TaxID=2528021 RepID=UPI0011A73683|nr:hypothetical protein [Anatilimnocola aggregata]
MSVAPSINGDADVRRRMPVIEVVDWQMAAVLREKTPAQRYAIALGLWHFARMTIRRRISAENPAWTAEQIHLAAAQRMLNES